MGNCFLTAAEKNLLEEIDRIIDWHIDHHKNLSRLTLSVKQSKSFARIVKKAEKCDKLYCDEGDVDIRAKAKGRLDTSVYRGVALYAKPERKRYSKKYLVELPL